MRIALIPPHSFRPPPLYYPALQLVADSSIDQADIAIVIVEDESRWSLDEVAFRIIKERRTPVVFVDPHDYNFYQHTEESILAESWFGAVNSETVHGLRRVRQFYHEVRDLGLDWLVFKLWSYQGLQHDKIVPLAPCVCAPVFSEETYDQYNARPYDVMFVGNSCPQREAACKAFQDSGLNVWFELYRQGPSFNRRLYSQPDWFNLHAKSRCFLETGAGAQGSARPFELGTLSLMVRQQDSVSWPYDWDKNSSFIEIGEALKPLTKDQVQSIIPILNDREGCYQRYLNGRRDALQFTPEKTAEYILQNIQSRL